MTWKQIIRLLRWLALIPLAGIWTLFTFFMAGYSFSALVAVCLMAILLFYNITDILMPAYPVPILILRRIVTIL